MKRPPLQDVVCFSHLRWNFVFQRPQHLMTRCAADCRVFFFEEPILDADTPHLEVHADRGVFVAVPHLPPATGGGRRAAAIRTLLEELLARYAIARPVLWYYTPMALEFSRGLLHSAIVYDCMDELSGFAGAPPGLLRLEAELLASASLVFTGGHTLFEAKRQRHAHVFPFPSSVDVSHFARARRAQADPPDQAPIGRPRLGFYGVIDERMDLGLVAEVARLRDDWQQIFIGPVVKIGESMLPRRHNIHYLGMKKYEELPAYLAGWDVAMMPFARNEATRFISPTKTPEYLAAGRPVVSTSIADVVKPYGHLALANIADDGPAFVAAIESCLGAADHAWLPRVDAFLADLSWDRTWAAMQALVVEAVERGARRDRRTNLRAGLPGPPPADRSIPSV
jgi:glycosyltransferase involved in cell wall biosynthesis